MNDYVYRNEQDTIRFRIFKTETDDWDYDIFGKGAVDVATHGVEAGDNFRTKREAKSHIIDKFGPVKNINPESVTEGW